MVYNYSSSEGFMSKEFDNNKTESNWDYFQYNIFYCNIIATYHIVTHSNNKMRSNVQLRSNSILYSHNN